MKIKIKDKVKIISGKDVGKTGTVLRVFKDKNRILVEGVNKVTKHVKPGEVSEEGGVINIEKPTDASNAMIICNKCADPVRVGYKVEDGKKSRICKKCGEKIWKRKQDYKKNIKTQ